jgi:2'-hydroxyisoflavone reductase
MIEREEVGTYNATGPDRLLTMADFLDGCRAASASDARFTWVSEQFLAEQGVAPWSELPLWLPASTGTHAYFSRTDIGRRLPPVWPSGRSARPSRHARLAAWACGPQAAREGGVPMPDVALAAEREHALLEAWHRQGET